VCAITPISYEHTDRLGNTLAEIAGEKAGIIKENGICVAAPQEKEALRVIEGACRSKKARLLLVGRDVLFEELASDGSREFFNILGLFGEYPRLETGLLGPHQIVNAATAVGIIEALGLQNVIVPEEAVHNGIKIAKWPGRLEVIQRRPFVILDGAHNKASVSILLKAHGFKVGFQVSPHLIDIRERFQIGNQLISKEKFIYSFNQIVPAIEKVKETEWGRLTYFEILAAFTFYLYWQEKVDFAVMETGLGGLYDATNVVTPVLSVITSIAYDHREVLAAGRTSCFPGQG